MCLKKPKVPKVPPPPQAPKPPDVDMLRAGMRRNRNGGPAGGTLLTGPMGIQGALTTGAPSLLGS